jgi:hypothetical protein
MRAALGFVGLIIALGIGYRIYTSQIEHMAGDKPLKQRIDMVGINADLMSLAQAERLYLATNGRYAPLDELRRSNMMNSFPAEERSGYRYSADVDGADHFKITASPTDSSLIDLPTLSIDETMTITR